MITHLSQTRVPRVLLSTLSATTGLLPIVLLAGCGGGNGKVVVSISSFDFGNVAVDTHQRRVVVSIANGTGSSVSLNPTLSGMIQSSISRSGSCEITILAGGACSVVLTFSPTTAGTQTGALNLNLQGQAVPANQSVALAGTGVSLDPGDSLVTATANPLVGFVLLPPHQHGANVR